MRKITCMLLLIQSGFMMAQTKTVVTQNGEKVTISPLANNGLTQNNGYIKLGGALTQASVLTTTSAYTLAITGLQAGNDSDNILVSDSNGVLKYIPRSSFGGNDNLGNHIATQDLNMSSKNILNISNAYIKNEAQFTDRVTSNTNYFGIYKNNGFFGIWNNLKNSNALTIDETTNKTTLISAQISQGTDGSTPSTGSVAVSADNSGNIKWVNSSSLTPNANNGLTNTSGTIQLGGALIKPTTINTSGSNTLEINSGGSSSTPISGFKIVDGTQGKDKVLTSDANGKTRWEAAGITLGSGVLGGGANIANNLTSSTSYVYTNGYVTLPPGKWLVTVNMLLAKTGNAMLASNEFWWVRSTFSNSSTSLAVSGDIQGTNKLISGGLNPNTNYGLMNGSVTILNSSTSNKTYYFVAGYLDGQNRAGNIANFGSFGWGENSIVFQAVH